MFTFKLILHVLLVAGDHGDVDLTVSDDDTAEDEAAALRKKLGIPEPDPDALPSTLIGKYLKLATVYVFSG